MDMTKMLSGYQLVEKGMTKLEATLPEVGIKDVVPNGSWLEQKQVQAAVEARKHLIEVERIEKWGNLSHAEWREDLSLAEVTEYSGSHWQYFGHHVDKQLYLNPEEALFLMEVNSLQLKINEVTVSLQQAYALLLRGKISLLQYKVFASLGRLGYKVFRHNESAGNAYPDSPVKESKNKDISNTEETLDSSNNILQKDGDINYKVDINKIINSSSEIKNINEKSNDTSIVINGTEEVVSLCEVNDTINKERRSTENNCVQLCVKENETQNTNVASVYIDEDDVGDLENVTAGRSVLNVEMEVDQEPILDTSKVIDGESNISMDTEYKDHINKDCNETTGISLNSNIKNIPEKLLTMLDKLKSRHYKILNTNDMNKYFENVPDLIQKRVVTVNVPDEEYIPKNIYVNNTTYVLNLEKVQRKNRRPKSNSSSTYSITDEVSGAHIRRLRSSLNNDASTYNRQADSNNQYRPFNFWRPQANMGYFQFNMLFQRPLFSNFSYMQRFQFYPRTSPFYFRHQFGNSPNSQTTPNSKKRTKNNAKRFHLEAIKRLALRLKQIVHSGNRQEQNLISLQRLIDTYNSRYETTLSLNHELEVVDSRPILETIELDDETESKCKKRRLDVNEDTFNENFKKIKQLALKLKEFESKNRTCARHRRAFSNMIKTFNKSFNADIYMTDNYEVFDRRHINLNSSDSDCVIEEPTKSHTSKKLRNPFNILKRRSERQKSITDATVLKNANTTETVTQHNKYSDFTIKTFKPNWLPDSTDFGSAEVPLRTLMNNRIIDSKKEDFLFDFLKSEPDDFNSWLDVKVSFFSSLEETEIVDECTPQIEIGNVGSIITSEDCTDMPSVLKKLSIINNDKEINETSLNIDFDVYNRDVQNFRKSNRPKPHFRVVCLSESEKVPSGSDISGLHSKYDDGVIIVFAIVGVGSISYIQINPTDLPVYLPNNEL